MRFMIFSSSFSLESSLFSCQVSCLLSWWNILPHLAFLSCSPLIISIPYWPTNAAPSFSGSVIVSCKLPEHYTVTRLLRFGILNLTFTAECRYSLLWPEATTFERLQRSYMRPEAAIVRCGQRPQHLKSHRTGT